MPNHGEIKAEALKTAYRLIDESTTGETSGDAVAEAMGWDKNDMGLYHALMALKDEGRVRLDFPGSGMQLPYRIRR